MFFSESIHVAYQIEGNGAQSTMQVHILSLHTGPLGMGQKVKKFYDCGHFALQIKGKWV